VHDVIDPVSLSPLAKEAGQIADVALDGLGPLGLEVTSSWHASIDRYYPVASP